MRAFIFCIIIPLSVYSYDYRGLLSVGSYFDDQHLESPIGNNDSLSSVFKLKFDANEKQHRIYLDTQYVRDEYSIYKSTSGTFVAEDKFELYQAYYQYNKAYKLGRIDLWSIMKWDGFILSQQRFNYGIGSEVDSKKIAGIVYYQMEDSDLGIVASEKQLHFLSSYLHSSKDSYVNLSSNIGLLPTVLLTDIMTFARFGRYEASVQVLDLDRYVVVEDPIDNTYLGRMWNAEASTIFNFGKGFADTSIVYQKRDSEHQDSTSGKSKFGLAEFPLYFILSLTKDFNNDNFNLELEYQKTHDRFGLSASSAFERRYYQETIQNVWRVETDLLYEISPKFWLDSVLVYQTTKDISILSALLNLSYRFGNRMHSPVRPGMELGR